MSKVLLVEDDIAIREPLARALQREGYTVVSHETGASALEDVADCDLVVLDLGLPDMDGLDVARQIRARGLGLPILILTARTEEVDMVVGLDAGADDYVTKPFRLAELMARVRALLRRSVTDEAVPSDLSCQDIHIDMAAHRAYQGNQELQLTAKEFDLLALLISEAGNVVSREVLMRKVWSTDPNSSSKTLDMHISWLRKKLADEASQPKYISTVRGMGFRFEENPI
ncbi:DNA-binding response regulator [Boudabousia liubingyangii]|uniref:DNA-binding response regulator n=1 Tax=Boudabousia liubingyangii TaxID=1921764 RepID=A0A1Q5PKY2_9ACTO|nr:response regulator transcription factor [Boudabousia liubingyangii]OKL46378.1 DNA-binding response regulator [Boudabousia liubingyangii]OKL47299.1 DNA-binding response regulator [Boudabousia liubingyangii]